MGKSFHRNSLSSDNRGVFVARAKERTFKLRGRNFDTDSEDRSGHASESRKVFWRFIEQVQRNAVQSIVFTRSIHTLDESIGEAMARGTLYQEFPVIPEDNQEHPIYSARTQKFMDQVLATNPKLTQFYLNQGKDVPLLLEYQSDAGMKQALSKEQIETIREYVRAYIESLLPPKEIEEVMEKALNITHEIQGSVEEIQRRIELIINIVLAQVRYKKSPKQIQQ